MDSTVKQHYFVSLGNIPKQAKHLLFVDFEKNRINRLFLIFRLIFPLFLCLKRFYLVKFYSLINHNEKKKWWLTVSYLNTVFQKDQQLFFRGGGVGRNWALVSRILAFSRKRPDTTIERVSKLLIVTADHSSK
jgi:hypothetical protein